MLNDVSTHFSSDNEGLGTIVLYSSAKIGVHCAVQQRMSPEEKDELLERERESSRLATELCVYSTVQGKLEL
jgi:hypothetical protein